MAETLTSLAPRVTEVVPVEGHALWVTFASGEVRRVDCRPFLDKGVFRRLQDEREFERVRPTESGGGIEWPSGADLSRSKLYLVGEPLAPASA